MLLFWLALIVAGTGLSSAGAAEPLPTDLGTRAQGIDWPDFLGPRRDSRSPETGLTAVVAEAAGGKPLRVVWQCGLGESYCAPSISRGRLFHFDRHGDLHRLTCRNSETGKEIWTYELPASFTDMLGLQQRPAGDAGGRRRAGLRHEVLRASWLACGWTMGRKFGRLIRVSNLG